MESKKMTVAQWQAVSNNPRQRDTDVHAAKAVNKHLKTYCPTHARVHAARLPGGDLVKLDGHTRALLWSDGRLQAPPVIYCDIHAVTSMDEAKALYLTFDNAHAAENARDKLSGAYREAGIHPQSTILTKGAMTSALRKLVPSSMDIYAAVRRWKPVIMDLDSLGISGRAFTGGMILGAMAMLRVRGARIHPFLLAF